MKKSILLACFIPLVSFAAHGQQHTSVAIYQELCAKEHDPVKRQNYCYMLEHSTQTGTMINAFRKDIATV